MPERARDPGGNGGRSAQLRTRTERSAGGVVYRRDPAGVRFLLIRDPYQNWGLPKGHIERGETPLAAALREVGEETGLRELELRGELPCIDWYFRDRGRLIHKYCDYFLLESAGGRAVPQRSEGISACAWLPLETALERSAYDNAREVLRTAGRILGLGDAVADD